MSEEKKEKKDSSERKSSEDEIEKPSYTYWKRDSDVKADHKGFSPQQTNEKVDINTNTNKIGSAWNKAGTWEEKKLTKKQIEDFFNDYVKKNKKIYKNSFYFDEFSGYSGDTYFVFSRGKIKYFYDCEMKLKIKGIDNEDTKGKTTTVTIKDISNEDEDDHFNFEYESGQTKKYLVNIFKTLTKEIEEDIRNIFEKLKESYLK
jgi:hypothetical protein